MIRHHNPLPLRDSTPAKSDFFTNASKAAFGPFRHRTTPFSRRLAKTLEDFAVAANEIPITVQPFDSPVSVEAEYFDSRAERGFHWPVGGALGSECWRHPKESRER